MRLWVTRSEPGAARTAARLEALGHAPLVAPLLALRPLRVALRDLDLTGVAALAFTSAAGVEAFAALSPDRAGRVYAVGGATARAARAGGWTDVRSADGDGAALAALIAEEAAGIQGVLLAPGAQDRAFDLEAALAPAGVAVRPLALYAARPRTTWPPPVRDVLERGDLDGLLLHSPAAARALAALARGAAPPLAGALAGTPVYALSRACAAVLPPAAAGGRRIAPAPREADLLALLPAAR